MSGFPISNVFVDNLNASNTLYVGGSINQNISLFTNVLPSSPSALEKIYNTTSELFETYYEGTGWVSSTPMPGQIFNLLSGEAPGLYIVNGSGVPILMSSLSSSFQIGGTAYVSTNGNDSTAQLDEPGLPYLTIGAAFIAASANPSILYTIYVFPGTYTVSENMCMSNISYVFSSGCTVNCSNIPFNSAGVNVSGCSVVGSASFVSTSSQPIINFVDSGGSGFMTQDVYFECQSITSSGTAIELQGTSSVTINVGTISGAISISTGITTNTTSANINASKIIGTINNISTLGTLYIDADSLSVANGEAIINYSNMYVNISNISAPISGAEALQNYNTMYLNCLNFSSDAAFYNDPTAVLLIMNIENIVQTSTNLFSVSYAFTSLTANSIVCLTTFMAVDGASTYIKANSGTQTTTSSEFTPFIIVSNNVNSYLESNIDTLTCGSIGGIGYLHDGGAGKAVVRGGISAYVPITIENTITSGYMAIAGTLYCSGSGEVSINAEVAATPIICYGSYANFGGTNTVISGLLTVGSYVVL
jgi:hypothetical protein